MIRSLIIALQLAAGLPFEDYCSRFNGKDCEVVWSAATNFPASLKSFAVVPTKFSPATVSNLLQIAELKSNQRKRVVQTGVFAGPDVRFFANREESRQLNLIPSQGFIVVSKDGNIAQIPKNMPVGVPDGNAALQLAVDILEKIGISRSELATNSEGKIHSIVSQGSVLHKDKGSGQILTNIIQCEVELSRQIGGIHVSGGGGISMKFGNEGRLAYMSIVRRSIQPDKDCPVPDVAEFISRIKSGRSFIRNGQESVTIKKLTVTKASLYYWENSGSEPQSHINPFTVLEAKTDLQGENSNVVLYLPLAVE